MTATNLMNTQNQAGELSQSKSTSSWPTTYVPRFDIWEADNELVLYGDLPGVTPESLDIRFENGELVVHGKVSPRHDGQFLYGEYGVGDFYRSFTVGEMIDSDKISAELQHGVLTLRLPKSEKVKPRRIEVKTS